RVGEAGAVRGAEEGAEPGAGVDHAAPAVGETHPGELREGREEVRGEPFEGGVALLVRGADEAAVVVDGVVAAEQDAVVAGEPVVVELVTRVAHALPVVPADL